VVRGGWSEGVGRTTGRAEGCRAGRRLPGGPEAAGRQSKTGAKTGQFSQKARREGAVHKSGRSRAWVSAAHRARGQRDARAAGAVGEEEDLGGGGHLELSDRLAALLCECGGAAMRVHVYVRGRAGGVSRGNSGWMGG
jgi:hypothetical protein